MAMRLGAGDLETITYRGESFALQGAADDIDEAFGQVGKISEGFVLDGRAVAIRMSKQIGNISLSLIGTNDSGHMHTAGFRVHRR
jgi:hypothetical protein